MQGLNQNSHLRLGDRERICSLWKKHETAVRVLRVYRLNVRGRGTNSGERWGGSSLKVKMAAHGVRSFSSAPSALALPRANS